MLTLSRLSAVINLANSFYNYKRKHKLTILSTDGGLVYSACNLAIDSHASTKEELLSLSIFFILERGEDNRALWDLHAPSLSQPDVEHKVKYRGKLMGESMEVLTFSDVIEKEDQSFQLSTFCQLIPDINLNEESVLILEDQIWSAGGNWAGIDLILTIIEEESGATAAMQLMTIVGKLFNKYENNTQLAVLKNLSYHNNSERINVSLRYIRENLRKNVTIDQLADLVNLSSRQFSRLFKEETGTSPAKAVLQIRAEVARQHVIQGRLSLNQISCLCGFSGIKSMRRAFLRFYGKSPGSFQNKQ